MTGKEDIDVPATKNPCVPHVHDTNPKAYARLAQQHMRNGRHEEAIAILKLGFSVFQNNGELLCDLSRALEAVGRLDEAVFYLEQTLQSFSDKLQAFKLLASIYKSQGKHDEAVAVYRVFLAHEKLQELFAQREAGSERPPDMEPESAGPDEEPVLAGDESKDKVLAGKTRLLTKMVKLSQLIEPR